MCICLVILIPTGKLCSSGRLADQQSTSSRAYCFRRVDFQKLFQHKMSLPVSTKCEIGMEASASDGYTASKTTKISSPTDSTHDSTSQCQTDSQTPVSPDSVENLEDYETQLFGFTPKSFVSGIYNAVSEYFMDALKTLEDYIAEHYGDLMSRTEVVEKMTIIRRHLVTQIDKAFDTLETYLAANIFCIPPTVVLPEDQVQIDKPVTREEEEQVLQEIEMVKKKILAVKVANAVLQKRLEQTMALKGTLDAILDHLNEADSTVRKEGVADLRDSLKHCSDRILGTIRILKDLKPADVNSTRQNDLPSRGLSS